MSKISEITKLREQNKILKKFIEELFVSAYESTDLDYEEDGSGDLMLRGIDGKNSSWKCLGDGTHSCGCNVFRRLKNGKYRCNACEQVWVGEK